MDFINNLEVFLALYIYNWEHIYQLLIIHYMNLFLDSPLLMECYILFSPVSFLYFLYILYIFFLKIIQIKLFYFTYNLHPSKKSMADRITPSLFFIRMTSLNLYYIELFYPTLFLSVL